MDILIKGMEMPKDDALSVIIYPDGVVEVQVGWNGNIPVYSNVFKATAILVPEHGDLIDRDTFIKEHEDGFVEQIMKGGDAIGRRIIPMRDVIKALNNAEVVLAGTT